MKKLILLLVGCFITLMSFAQPSFYRAYSRTFGEIQNDGKVEWGDPEDAHTLFKVENDVITIYANETIDIHITKNIGEDDSESLIYECVDSDGGDCTLFISKTEEGANFMILRYTFAAVLFFFNTEQ